jgi:enamine deaminase RidA (YjgF/YER057c/UK114 family)
MELLNPATLGAPAAAYSLAVHVPAGARWLHTSGIVATLADGTISEDLGEQAREIWRSIAALCAAARMTLADVVSYTTYVVDGQDLSVVMAARDAAFAGHRPASTLIVVPRLARPQWLMEITAVAATTRP